MRTLDDVDEYKELLDFTDEELKKIFEDQDMSVENLRKYIIPIIIENNGEIRFEGDNCNDIGLGGRYGYCYWDGIDRRCMCGNRRVYWTRSDNDYWYGQAD